MNNKPVETEAEEPSEATIEAMNASMLKKVYGSKYDQR